MLTPLHFKRLAASKLLPMALAVAALNCGNTGPDDAKTAGNGGSAGSDEGSLGDVGGNGGTSTSANGGSGGSTSSTATSASDGGGGNGSAGDNGSGSPSGSVGGSAGASYEGADDPRCNGAEPGVACLGHFITSCIDDDADGFVDFAQMNCAPGVCTGEEPSCTTGSAGESCADPIVVTATGFVLRGTDFASKFGGDIDLSGSSCDFGDSGSSDAVFAVSLEAGQVLSVTQKGTLPAVIALQTACGGEEECSDSDVGAAGIAVEYPASRNETVYVILNAFQAGDEVLDYALHIDIDSTCGNGIYEGPEACDDGNTAADDGCSPGCNIEFPYQCTESSPSLCQQPESLGRIGVDGVLGREVSTRFDEDDRLFLSFTVTERVLLDLSAVSNTGNTGDIDFHIYSDWENVVVPGTQSGNEYYEDRVFEPGTYLIELWAATDLPSGFTLSFTGHGSVCGDFEVVRGLEECDDGGGEGCPDCEVVFGWDCGIESPSECVELTKLGPYAAGDPIEPVSEDWVDYYRSAYWMIEFDDDVWLSGTAVSQSDSVEWVIDSVTIWSEDEAVQSSYVYPPDGEFGPWFLPAGTYKIDLLTYTGLDYGYVLSLSTTNPAP